MTTERTPDGEEFVVLRDAAGHYYLLPWTTLEAARVSDASVASLEAQLGDEVAGYGMLPSQMGAPTSLTQQGIIIVSGTSALGSLGIAFTAPAGWNRVRNVTGP